VANLQQSGLLFNSKQLLGLQYFAPKSLIAEILQPKAGSSLRQVQQNKDFIETIRIFF